MNEGLNVKFSFKNSHASSPHAAIRLPVSQKVSLLIKPRRRVLPRQVNRHGGVLQLYDCMYTSILSKC